MHKGQANLPQQLKTFQRGKDNFVGSGRSVLIFNKKIIFPLNTKCVTLCRFMYYCSSLRISGFAFNLCKIIS